VVNAETAVNAASAEAVVPAAGAADATARNAAQAKAGRHKAKSTGRNSASRVRTAAAANAITTYSLPDARREYLPRLPVRFTRMSNGTIQQVRETYSDGRRGDFPLSPDGGFAFVVPFSDGPGVYTVVVWVRASGAKEAIAATNVSIRVTNSGGARPAISSSGR